MDNSSNVPSGIQNINRLEKSWALFASKTTVPNITWDENQNSFTLPKTVSTFFAKTIRSIQGKDTSALDLSSAFFTALATTQKILEETKAAISTDPTLVKSYRVALENLQVTLTTSIYGNGGYSYLEEKLKGDASDASSKAKELLQIGKKDLYEKAILPELDKLISSLSDQNDDLLDGTFNTLSQSSNSTEPQKQLIREMLAGIQNDITPVALKSDPTLFIPGQGYKDFPRSSGYWLNNNFIHDNDLQDWEPSYKEYVKHFQEMYGKTTGEKLAFKVMSLTSQTLLADLLLPAINKTGLTPVSSPYYFSVTITPEKISIEMRTLFAFHDNNSVMPMKRVITLDAKDLKGDDNTLPSLEVKDTWLPLFKDQASGKEILHKF